LYFIGSAKKEVKTTFDLCIVYLDLDL
jgi:hypothetical protein